MESIIAIITIIVGTTSIVSSILGLIKSKNRKTETRITIRRDNKEIKIILDKLDQMSEEDILRNIQEAIQTKELD